MNRSLKIGQTPVRLTDAHWAEIGYGLIRGTKVRIAGNPHILDRMCGGEGFTQVTLLGWTDVQELLRGEPSRLILTIRLEDIRSADVMRTVTGGLIIRWRYADNQPRLITTFSLAQELYGRSGFPRLETGDLSPGWQSPDELMELEAQAAVQGSRSGLSPSMQEGRRRHFAQN